MIPSDRPRLTKLAVVQRMGYGERTLKVALATLLGAGEGRLRLLLLELIQDLPVRDVTHLEVLIDQLSLLVAHTALAFGHERVACLVRLAHIAVYALPSFTALAVLLLPSRSSVAAIGQRAAEGFRAVFSAEAGGAIAFPVRFATLGELVAFEVL